MPRKPRFYLPGLPVHLVQRGHSQQPVFFENDNYLAYLHWLGESAERYECHIHAYVLMTNHVHILASPVRQDGISLMMQRTGRHYVPYINHNYGGSGTLWEGRYKACLIHDNEYLMACMRYIELNPVRAKMTKTPAGYRWSSYHANAQGKENSLITPHPLYMILGKTRQQRTTAYKSLFKSHLDNEELDKIRASWQSGTPLGNDSFKQQIQARLKCRPGQVKRGRPKKAY